MPVWCKQTDPGDPRCAGTYGATGPCRRYAAERDDRQTGVPGVPGDGGKPEQAQGHSPLMTAGRKDR